MVKISNSELLAKFLLNKPLTECMMDDVKEFFRKYTEKWNVKMSVTYKDKMIFSNIK